MLFGMVFGAQPDYIKRLAIIRVMSLAIYRATDKTILLKNFPISKSII